MKVQKKILYFLFVVLLLACKKDEKIEHENYTVDGNKPPPYSGVSSVLVDNYVNKLSIDLIGLKPDEITLETRSLYLQNNELSEVAREKVVDDILKEEAYHDRLFQVNSDLLLNGMGYDEIQGVYDEYAYVRDFLYQSGDTFTAQYIDNEVIKLQLLLDAPDDYRSGNITLNEYFKRMSYNLVYDEINMGSENFVISCFENFFKRKPTVKEQENGINMVDGQTVTFLLESGRNKVDFLDIMISNPEFYQGRVIDAYRALLLREAESEELSTSSGEYQKNDDYGSVLKSIAITDEYAGFE